MKIGGLIKAAAVVKAVMDDMDQSPGPDSRPARREAVEAALLWCAALIATVVLSTWLGGRVEPILGVPRWAAVGVFMPWLVFFGLHLWFCRRRESAGSKP